MLASFETPSADAAGNCPGSVTGAGASQNLQTHSPSSDAFSTQPHEAGNKANGIHRGDLLAPPRKPDSAFELYCAENRGAIKDKNETETESAAGNGGGSSSNDKVEDELAQGWKDLSEDKREEFEARADGAMAKYEKDKDAYDASVAAEAAEAAKKSEEADADAERPGASTAAGGSTRGDQSPRQQEDVEMGNYDTDQETQG
jgi:hypothetical protein